MVVRILEATVQLYCDECQRAADAELELRERAERVERLLAASGATARMRRWSLDTYPESRGAARRDGMAWLHGYRAGERRNLLVFGKAGHGKTGLAWSLARHLAETDLTEILFVNFRELLSELRASFDERGRRPSEYSRAGRVPVLVLDDLGSERPTPWAREELLGLVDRRYGALLPMIVTSNYLPSELAGMLGADDEKAGERILDRLTDEALQIRIGGRSLRGR